MLINICFLHKAAVLRGSLLEMRRTADPASKVFSFCNTCYIYWKVPATLSFSFYFCYMNWKNYIQESSHLQFSFFNLSPKPTGGNNHPSYFLTFLYNSSLEPYTRVKHLTMPVNFYWALALKLPGESLLIALKGRQPLRLDAEGC